MIDGQETLHVKYSVGGSTPGDSYRWIIDENYLPTSYKMYVPSMIASALKIPYEIIFEFI